METSISIFNATKEPIDLDAFIRTLQALQNAGKTKISLCLDYDLIDPNDDDSDSELTDVELFFF